SLDPTFGTGGIANGPVHMSGASSLVIQPDSKLVAAGKIGEQGAVARYNTNGSPDSTFGNNGIALITETPYIYALALQSDGKLVGAGGSIITQYGFGPGWLTLIRYNTNGFRDNSFGSGGIVTNPAGNSSAAQSLAIQQDGKLVIAARFEPSIFAVGRFNPN